LSAKSGEQPGQRGESLLYNGETREKHGESWGRTQFETNLDQDVRKLRELSRGKIKLPPLEEGGRKGMGSVMRSSSLFSL